MDTNNREDNIINTADEDSTAEDMAVTTDETIVSDTAADADGEYSTVDVSQEDIQDEMLRYGVSDEESEEESPCEESEADTAKKPLVQRPIIIAAVALIVTAAIVLGTYFVYNTFFKPGISGAWVIAENPDSGTYFVFDKDGNVAMDGGAMQYFGTYTMDKNEAGQDVMKTEFYLFSYYGGEATVTYSPDKNTMILGFAAGEIMFKKAELPQIDIIPDNITHASADELGVTSLNIDKAIVGSWNEEMYGTYTFNADGTGTYLADYSYSDYYGYGYGVTYDFKYTVHEDEILVTLDYYTGDTEDGTFVYYIDGGNLVLNGVGYTKVTK